MDVLLAVSNVCCVQCLVCVLHGGVRISGVRGSLPSAQSAPSQPTPTACLTFVCRRKQNPLPLLLPADAKAHLPGLVVVLEPHETTDALPTTTCHVSILDQWQFFWAVALGPVCSAAAAQPGTHIILPGVHGSGAGPGHVSATGAWVLYRA